MITTVGKTFIKRYLAGKAGTAAGAISLGIGDVAAQASDTSLQFEFARIPVALTEYDFVDDKLVFKGSVPAEIAGKIYEIGLWTDEINALAGNQGSRLVTSFESDSEEWTSGTFDTNTVRIGPDSLKHTPSASTTTTSTMSNLTLDFGANSAADKFIIAYNVDNANVANIKIRFMKDVSNYYEFTITSPTSGYKFSTFTKGSATLVGTPSWEEVNELSVLTTATSGGVASVEYDGIRLEDVDTVSPEYGLIARFILASPIEKVEGSVQDIEYRLNVTA